MISCRTPRRTVQGLLVATLAMLLAGATAAIAGTPTTIVATPNDEFHGSGNADYFAWTFVSNRAPGTAKIKVKPTGGNVTTLNDQGRWLSGSMDQTGSLLPYWRIRGHGRDRTMDVHVYDMQAQTGAGVPPNVNTAKLEYFPAISGNQMTFVRTGSRSTTLYLVTDRTTGAKVAVKTLDLRRAIFANAPNLIGNWVTYAVCRATGCEAYRYDISQATTVTVPNPLDKFYFAPSADLLGNVYLERSGAACGSNAKLMKWTGGVANPSVFYSFATGHDMIGTSVYDDGAGNVTLYADTLSCARANADIVSFLDP